VQCDECIDFTAKLFFVCVSLINNFKKCFNFHFGGTGFRLDLNGTFEILFFWYKSKMIHLRYLIFLSNMPFLIFYTWGNFQNISTLFEQFIGMRNFFLIIIDKKCFVLSKSFKIEYKVPHYFLLLESQKMFITNP